MQPLSRAATAALFLALSTASAWAADYLSTVESEVFTTTGDTNAIAGRAKTCMARLLAPGVQGGQLFLSADGPVLVANNVLKYPDGLLQWTMRSRMTFEARDGRFRITHEGIERFNDQAGGWSPVGKWTGSGWKKAEATLQDVSSSVAACVKQDKSKDW